MATFNDREGDPWVIDLNVTTLKFLKANGMDVLGGLSDGSFVDKLMQDPIYLVDLIYLLCKKQADERNVSDEQFGVLVGHGETIVVATQALMDELALFSPGRGEALKLAMEKFRLLETKLSLEAVGRLEKITMEEIEKITGDTLAKQQASSESTQDHSRLES